MTNEKRIERLTGIIAGLLASGDYTAESPAPAHICPHNTTRLIRQSYPGGPTPLMRDAEAILQEIESKYAADDPPTSEEEDKWSAPEDF